MHPWHEIDIDESTPQIVNAVIEIPSIIMSNLSWQDRQESALHFLIRADYNF
jgi:hypothetical protein